MTMASIDFPYNPYQDVSRNPKSPDRKLPVQPTMFETPDRTISTAGSESVVDSPHGDLSHEINGMITVVKSYVQAPQGYSPTRKEFETTMEAIEAKAEEEDAAWRQQQLEQAAQMQAEEASFFDNIFGAFSLSSVSAREPSPLVKSPSTVSARGTVVHEMLKRLVLQELQSRRDKSATTIQSAARRLLAQKKKEELRVIATERKRALHELALLHKYDQYSSSSSSKGATKGEEENRAGSTANDDEVAEEIKTSKFSKMKSRLKTLRKKKEKKKSKAKAPLLPMPSVPEDERSFHGIDDSPVQEKPKKSKWKKMVKKMKAKKLLSKKQSTSKQVSPVLDGVVEDDSLPVPQPGMNVIITTTDDSIPSPEAEAEAEAYRLRHQPPKQQQQRGQTPEEESTRRTFSSLPSSLPSGRNFRWSNFVLADDATSITSARTRPLLDSWFRSFVFDRETLKELDDDAIEEMVEIAFTNGQLQKDLSLIPEMDWTEEDWMEARQSLFQCSKEHVEEITFQTKRFVNNEVSL